MVPGLPGRRRSPGRRGADPSGTHADPAVARYVVVRWGHDRDFVGDDLPSGARGDELGGYYSGAARHGDVRRVYATSRRADPPPGPPLCPSARIGAKVHATGGDI